MKIIPLVTGLCFMAAPMVALAQTAPSYTAPSSGQRASHDFRNAGGSVAHAARSGWHGVEHGWSAVKSGAKAGWNTTVHGTPNPPR